MKSLHPLDLFDSLRIEKNLSQCVENVIYIINSQSFMLSIDNFFRNTSLTKVVINVLFF